MCVRGCVFPSARLARSWAIHASTPQHIRKIPEDEERSAERIVTLASQYGRYGYRRIAALLWNEGWRVNHKRVERICRQERLESTDEAAQTGAVLANGRIMYPTPS